MELKPGSRWKSAVCDAEVVVVRPPKTPVSLECGGHAMVAAAAQKPAGASLAADRSGGVAVGKRFADDETGLEVLCVKAGAGSISVDGRELGVKEAKKLPASD
jgi:hypothetical protein